MKSGTLWVRHKVTLVICVLGKYLAVDHKGRVEGRPGLLEVNYAQSGGFLPSTTFCRRLEGIGFVSVNRVSFALVFLWGTGQIRHPGVQQAFAWNQEGYELLLHFRLMGVQGIFPQVLKV